MGQILVVGCDMAPDNRIELPHLGHVGAVDSSEKREVTGSTPVPTTGKAAGHAAYR